MHTQVDPDLMQGLQANKRRWARLPIAEKIDYLRQMRRLTVRYAQDWADAGASIKGFAPESPLAVSEEWIGGSVFLAGFLTDLVDSLTALDRGADMLAGIRTRARRDGQVVAQVLPRGIHDRLQPLRAEVWMQPGVTIDGLRSCLAPFYRQSDPPGRVTLVLGAGNVAALTALDMLTVLFVDGDVVVAKMNPINDAYRPVLEEIFAPLIHDGFARFVSGGADIGAALAHDDRVQRVHMTGGTRTYNAIVWGTGPDAVARRQRGQPLLDKPVTAELGGVSPTIVIPGRWSDADLALQAQAVATQKLFNSGHVCAASQVLVLPQAWPQAGAFLAALRAALTAAPDRDAFYPGTQATIEAFTADNPTAELLSCRQPRVLLTGVDPAADHPAFHDEVFGPIHLSTSLPGSTPQEYLANAVAFSNDRLAGNLAANLIVDPATAKALGPHLEDRIADLRYGNIGVNTWSVLLATVGRCPWGAFPGNDPTDIQSGVGFVHNALMFPQPQRSVGWGSFRPTPPIARRGRYPAATTPFWLLDKQLTPRQARVLLEHTTDPSTRTLLRVLKSMLLP